MLLLIVLQVANLHHCVLIRICGIVFKRKELAPEIDFKNVKLNKVGDSSIVYENPEIIEICGVPCVKSKQLLVEIKTCQTFTL